MGVDLTLVGEPQASVDGGIITVSYEAKNGGDSESGPFSDRAVLTDGDSIKNENGNYIYDTANIIHSIGAGESYSGKIDQFHAAPAGTYTVKLILDSEGSANEAWSGEVTVGS